MKKNEATWTFLNLVLTKLAVPGLWRLYFGVLSRQISFWTFLELQLTILACKLYVSSACCVNIKFRVHVYSVFVWISLHSPVAVAVSVCRFSFASVTEQWHDDIYNTRRNWKHLPSLILHSKLVLYEGLLGNKKNLQIMNLRKKWTRKKLNSKCAIWSFKIQVFTLLN